MLPFVSVAAARYVPASILSEGMKQSPPFNSETPVICISSVPAPSIFAPIELRKFAKSTTSGSLAAFLKIVSPSAKTAAMIKFSVPVTVTPPKVISAPLRFLAFATM